MPKASPFALQEATGPDGLLAAVDMLEGTDADNWRRAVMLLETVELGRRQRRKAGRR